MKPRMFVGSSSENLDIAWAVQTNLSRDAEVTVWNQGVFKLSRTSLESLIETLDQSEFGVFIFSPEDLVEIRGEENRAVRDNVLLELGFFLGRLGRDRCFILVPEDASDLRIPTDLIGITPAIYESDRSDDNWQAATGPACNFIRQAIQKSGQKSEGAEAPDVGPKPSEPTANAAEVESEVRSQPSEKCEKSDSNEEETNWISAYFDKQYERSLEILYKMISSAEYTDEQVILLEGWVGRVKYDVNSTSGIQYLEGLIEKHPENSWPYLQLARALVSRDLHDKGLEVIERGLAKCDDPTDLILEKVDCLQDCGDEQRALDSIRKAIKDSPQTAKFYIAEADLYVRKELYDDARVALARANQEIPDNEELLLAYAALLNDRFDRKLALIPYGHLLRFSPDNSAAITFRANILLALGLNDLAMSSYQRANELSEGERDWILSNIGNLFKNRGLYGEAIRYLKLALDKTPDNQYAHERIAIAIKLHDEENEKLTEILKEAKGSLINWKPNEGLEKNGEGTTGKETTR